MTTLRQAADAVMAHQWSASREAMDALTRLVDAAYAADKSVVWAPASTMPPQRKPLDFESVVVLAIAETDDGSCQITPAKVVSLRKAEWREVRFDHNGQGRKIVVRCWTPMPPWPKKVPPAQEVTRISNTTTPAPQPLTDEDVARIVREASSGSAFRRDGTTSTRIARAVEAEVLRRLGV